MDNRAFFKIGYGLYVLSVRENNRDNACIINTVCQVTMSPSRITLAVNKQNLTHDILRRTGIFNISILTQKAPFDIFKHFGYQSGNNVDKFMGRSDPRAENGVIYLPDYTNAILEGKIITETDLGSHTLFLAEITDTKVLSDEPSVTYDFYQNNIKPAPTPVKTKGWQCRICGYIYEGEELPPDYICPICKHGASDFEKIV